jgi:hypothetical protein
MKFTPIGEDATIHPGEYLYHEPSSAIVLVGSFNREKNKIRGIRDGRLMEDKIGQFQRIELDRKERQKLSERKGCSGCKGR